MNLELPVELKAQALALANAAGTRDDALATLRRDARAQLEAADFPDRKTEQWRYTPLQALTEGHLTATGDAGAGLDALPDFGGWRIVFINGHFAASHSRLPEQTGLTTQPLAQSGTRTGESDTLLQTPFAWLNGAMLNDGLRVAVDPGVVVEQPLHVVFFGASEAPATVATRLQVNLGTNSQLTLIEQYAGHGPLLTNAVTTVDTADGARLTHYRLQNESGESLHVGSLAIDQQQNSTVQGFQLMHASRLRRNDVRAALSGAGAALDLRGIFVGRGKTHVDNHICVEHRAPHCTSHQLYKGLAGGHSKAVFNGRIHIHPGAMGSNADLTNKNLLLSRQAEVDTKPELEIYNDDVKCAHGTTVGQIDETAVFYLQSRGISRQQARRMLATGFVNELLMALPEAPVAEWSQPWLESALAEDA